MKIVKTILTVLLILLVVFMTINVFIPASYRVQRYVEIDASPKKLYNHLRDLNNIKEWSSWAEGLSDSSIQLKGDLGEEESSVQINSSTQNIELKILKLEPTNFIKINIQSQEYKSFKAAYFKIETAEESGKTKLIFGVQGRRAFPFRLFNLMMDKAIAKDLNKTLSKLSVRFKTEY